MAKNSGFLPRMSSSGWASAKAERTARWAPFRRAQRVRLGSGPRSDKVEDPGSGRELLRALDVEALAQALLEPFLLVVGMIAGALPREQPAHHRVVGRRKLDYEGRFPASASQSTNSTTGTLPPIET